jgi:hypothetical protein
MSARRPVPQKSAGKTPVVLRAFLEVRAGEKFFFAASQQRQTRAAPTRGGLE